MGGLRGLYEGAKYIEVVEVAMGQMMKALCPLPGITWQPAEKKERTQSQSCKGCPGGRLWRNPRLTLAGLCMSVCSCYLQFLQTHAQATVALLQSKAGKWLHEQSLGLTKRHLARWFGRETRGRLTRLWEQRGHEVNKKRPGGG